jgi:hypothetical protein
MNARINIVKGDFNKYKIGFMFFACLKIILMESCFRTNEMGMGERGRERVGVNLCVVLLGGHTRLMLFLCMPQ